MLYKSKSQQKAYFRQIVSTVCVILGEQTEPLRSIILLPFVAR